MLSITKLQNLKAIHNTLVPLSEHLFVVINHKTTKFESNSQPMFGRTPKGRSCYQSQNYKIWKQFTTTANRWALIGGLLSITKLQNLKAIHNKIDIFNAIVYVVINHKTTKFESNSQLCSIVSHWGWGCYQSQNYKIWKQFTTFLQKGCRTFQLLSITKLQNLKAIHNTLQTRTPSVFVVINHKTTKFESNSQQSLILTIT